MKRLVVLFLAGALVISACGDDDDNGDSQSTETSRQSSASRPSPSSEPATTEAAGAPATVRAGSTTQYGEVAVDADGKSLYLFANDTGTTSAVPEGVLAAWPPIIAEGEPTAGEGIDASKLGVAEQPNGERWVTYNDHILYRFTGDTAPGDTNGQGLGMVWYLVSAEGERIG
jgi:predicted lipoprotein with Yx(FWY)xxD motif